MKTLSILILMVGFAAHAKGGADAAKGFTDAIKAGRAAKPALDAGAAAANLTRELKAIVGSILEQTTPRDADVFRAELDKVSALDSTARQTLVKAYQAAVLDKGCMDAQLTPDAYKNLSLAITRAVNELFARQTNMNALAQMAKNSDFNNDKRVSPEEQKLSDDAEVEAQLVSDMVVADFAKTMHKNGTQSVESVQHLGARCGLSPAIAARARASAVRAN